MPEPPVSVSWLVMMLTNIGHTIEQDHKVKNKERYWRCLKCILKTSLRFGTIFYKIKLKVNNFVMMVYCFTEWNRTNAWSSNKSSLQHENYKDKTMSSRTVNGYYNF